MLQNEGNISNKLFSSSSASFYNTDTFFSTNSWYSASPKYCSTKFILSHLRSLFGSFQVLTVLIYLLFSHFILKQISEAARLGIICASDIQSSKGLTDVPRQHSWMCGAPGTRILYMIPNSESTSSTVKCANTVNYHPQNFLLVAILNTHLENYSLWRLDGSTPWAEKPCRSPSEDTAEVNASHGLLMSESHLKESSLLPLASHHSSISCLENPMDSQWGSQKNQRWFINSTTTSLACITITWNGC